MRKINQLSSEIYNKISAGEVIERPASIVKELTENSIDAGATSIKITIKDGGLKYINVSDNGNGIYAEELPVAFLRHSTSKIKEENDLNNIRTLGFRGEALASIAAVSKVTMISRTEDSPTGHEIFIAGGEASDIKECASNTGTSVTVQDLFYNTPARLKFLKKVSGETAEITNIVTRLILANPNISIKYTADNEIIYNSQGKGSDNAFYCIYGSQALNNCIPVRFDYKKYSIKGFISSLNYFKSNSTYQTLVINGRYVVNNTVSTAIKAAYRPYLMTRQYPMYLLYLTLPYDEIDVNVHPNKLDVRFASSKDVFSAFYSLIVNALKNEEKQTIADIKEQVPVKNMELSDTVSDFEAFFKHRDNLSNRDFESFVSNSNETGIKTRSKDIILPAEFSAAFDAHANDKRSSPEYIINKLIRKETEEKNFFSSELIQKGNLFNTYLILESTEDDCVYVVDQHAAHERLLFDKLIRQYEENKLMVQPLLIPYTFSVNSVESEFINNNIDIFRECGFEIRSLGTKEFCIDSVPLLLSEVDIEKFIKYTLSEMDNGTATENFTREYLARNACHHAIKAGEQLSSEEIKALIELLKKDTLLKCPHGRPIVVRVSKTEIEKWFKRIV